MSQGGPGNNGNKKIVHTFPISWTEATQADAV